jgi:two-component system cell cycle sensor histidine kinase/response regulator CckA
MLRSLLPASVSFEVVRDGDPVVYADVGQLEQVVLNLVVNARDALPRGGWIRVATGTAVHEGRECATLSIADNGAGMTAEVRAHLFEPFFTTKDGSGGTGLGLAVVDTVVRNHDGAIAVESEPGKGAVFRVYLPLSHGRPQAGRATAATKAGAYPGECVLVVDDDRDIRVVLERLLSRAGFRVVLAAEGAAALDALASHPAISLVLTDLIMPGMSGHELVTRLRELGRAIPVVVMTGYAPNGLGEDARHLLAKPFTANDLLAVVRRAIDEG